MANVWDYDIVINKFEIQLRYYIDFRTNTNGKIMNILFPTRYGLNSTTIFLLKGWILH